MPVMVMVMVVTPTVVMVMVAMATVAMDMRGTSTPSLLTRPLTLPCSASADGWGLTTTHLVPVSSQIILHSALLTLLQCKSYV